MQSNEGVAAVSGRLINVQSLAEAELRAGAAWQESERNHGLSLLGFVVPDLYGDAPESFYPSGGLCLLRRSAIAAQLPELLPRQYFAYHEDVWLGFRLRSRGLRVLKEPRAIAAHVEGSTTRRTLSESHLRFLQERNRWLNILGWYPACVLWRMLPLLLVQALVMCALALLTRPRRYFGTMAAHLWLLTHPLAILRHRHQSRQIRAVPDREWLRQLSGQVRGRGGLANRLALLWCRVLRIPHREQVN
jgi:GT2 family glycosyltransferase